MTPLRRRLLRAGVNIEAVIRRAWEITRRLFLSQTGLTRRAAGRFDALKRREMEAERLDRLRNPGNYQGK
jgi:hypothetical protein